MAIKTKKISDLGQITVESSEVLNKADFYLLGCKGGVTGKVATSDVVKAIRADANEGISSLTRGLTNSNDFDKLAERVTNNSTKIDVLTEKLDNFISTLNETSNLTKINEISLDVEKLKQFIITLQKDGYLTLAEIKKAAAEACPICNHTHEEETTAES